jgi:hypothetical protein
MRRSTDGLFIGQLYALPLADVWTVLKSPVAPAGFLPLKAFLEATPDVEDIDRAIFNARSAGISHLALRHSGDLPALAAHGVFRWLIGTSTAFLDVLLTADLQAELHPAQEGCWEAYELADGPDGLMTPDTSIPLFGSTAAIAGFMPVNPHEVPWDAESLTLNVNCPVPAPGRSSARYRLIRWRDH